MCSKDNIGKEPLPEDRCLQCGAGLEPGERDLCARCNDCSGDMCRITVTPPEHGLRAHVRTIDPVREVRRE